VSEDRAAAWPDIPTLGVEEELLLVDPATGELAPHAPAVLARAPDAEHELRREQVETGTEPSQTLAQLRRALVANRRELAQAAASRGLSVVATGAAWISPEQARLTDEDRYQRMAEIFGPIALRQLVDGCHVHVGMPDRNAAIEVVNRVRPWLSVLLALSANSPFWDGDDTGYASFRHEVWSRWPTATTAGPFSGIADYQATVEQLIRSGAAVDAGMIYFHIRPSARWPTVEFRIADVCLTVDETVLTAALSRALAVTALAEARSGDPVPEVRPPALRAAQWRAARYGLDGALVSVRQGTLRPAAAVVEELLEHVRPALEAADDSGEVHRIVQSVLARGNGAHRQRRAYRRGARFEDVVALLIEETSAG
jgi:carboxylate-amine ligase